MSVPNIWQMAPSSAEILLCAPMSMALVEVTYPLVVWNCVCAEQARLTVSEPTSVLGTGLHHQACITLRAAFRPVCAKCPIFRSSPVIPFKKCNENTLDVAMQPCA